MRLLYATLQQSSTEYHNITVLLIHSSQQLYQSESLCRHVHESAYFLRCHSKKRLSPTTRRTTRPPSSRFTALHPDGSLGIPSLSDSAPVPLPLEVEVQVQDAALEGALEALLVTVLPLLVDDPEGDVFIGRPRVESQEACTALLVCVGILFCRVDGRFRLVNEIRVENVELVALYHLCGTVRSLREEGVWERRVCGGVCACVRVHEG